MILLLVLVQCLYILYLLVLSDIEKAPSNLNWGEKAAVRVNREYSNKIEIPGGVRQGSVLSLLLFNVCNDLRYVDNFVVIAESLKNMVECPNTS